MRLHKYNEEQLRNAVKSSSSIRQSLIKLGIAPYGGNYAVFRKAVKFFKVDTAHFTGLAWSKDKVFPSRFPLSSYLSNERSIRSCRLKERLIKEGVFEHKCYRCNGTKWQDHIIPLELEHINGNPIDNRLENLTLLCPNCHALTPTYRNRKR